MNSSFILLKVDPQKLAYLRFVLEGYDHLAILSVLEPEKGLVKIYFFERERPLVEEILEDLKSELSLELIS